MPLARVKPVGVLLRVTGASAAGSGGVHAGVIARRRVRSAMIRMGPPRICSLYALERRMVSGKRDGIVSAVVVGQDVVGVDGDGRGWFVAVEDVAGGGLGEPRLGGDANALFAIVRIC